MALFQKKNPSISNSAPLYSLGLQQTFLIVGLGNIGKQYDGTRHNIGFACADDFAKRNDFPDWIEKKDLQCHITNAKIGDHKIIVIKPSTLMNLSGRSVFKTAQFYKITPANTVVLQDEIDLEFGEIRAKIGGGSAGHNGIKSIIENIGEEFSRVRIGIGPKEPAQMDSADFVLAKFSPEQQEKVPLLTAECSSILSRYIQNNGKLTNEKHHSL